MRSRNDGPLTEAERHAAAYWSRWIVCLYAAVAVSLIALAASGVFSHYPQLAAHGASAAAPPVVGDQTDRKTR